MESWKPSISEGEIRPFSLRVQLNPNEPPESITVNANTTVADLLSVLPISTLNVSSRFCYLTQSGNPLRDEQILYPTEDTLVLMTGVYCGVPRPDIPSGPTISSLTFQDFQSIKIIHPDPVGPRWRVVGRGISFRTKCKTEGCVAFGKILYITKGYGMFVIEHQIATLMCPMCEKRACQGDNLGFLQAKFNVTGMKVGEEEESKSEGETKGMEYYTFLEGGKVDWKYLVAIVSPI